MSRTHVIGRGMPLRRSEIDTDQIIPARSCLSTERSGFGIGLFGDWREEDSFVLNNPEYAEAKVLVAGAACNGLVTRVCCLGNKELRLQSRHCGKLR